MVTRPNTYKYNYHICIGDHHLKRITKNTIRILNNHLYNIYDHITKY